MAKDFSVKEAKQLIDRHTYLLSIIDDVHSKELSLLNEIKQSANRICIDPVTKHSIINYVNEKINDIPKDEETSKLICALYQYYRIKNSIETARAYSSILVKNINANMSMLKPGLFGLSWVFSSKKTKDEISRAYNELASLLDDNYGQTVPFLKSDINSLDHISQNEAWNAFFYDPGIFYNTAEELIPQALHSHNNTLFANKIEQLNDLHFDVNVCRAKPDTERDQIKNTAEKLIANNALKILDTVPVEELNREKEGFRIKALRDAGINTMADVYTSSFSQLSSIYGVSESAASSMKRYATKLLMDAKDDIKIKLNADDRNKLSTDLIKAIYVYRNKLPARKELDDIIASNQSELSYSKDALKSIGNNLFWIFCSSEQRNSAIEAYSTINSALNGSYKQRIRELIRIISSSEKAPSTEMVWEDFEHHNIEYFSILEDIFPNILGNDDILYGLPEDLAREIQEETLFPDGLLCTLRRYQEWGVKYILHQKNVLLGDEMGLGKTVQAIATMVSLRNTGATHFLVICPASVITNWCREIVKHSRLRVTKIHGSGRAQAIRSWAKTGGVAVTTFETTSYIKDENVEKINLTIVDEAHYIKNPNARRTVNVKRLCAKSDRMLFMTGTALENKVEEMVSLIEVLQPDIAASIAGMTFMPSAPQFRKRVAPVYYRRKREDVLTELPDLIETKEWCVLNPEEKRIYEEDILAHQYPSARRLSWNVSNIKNSCKANRLLEIIEEAKSEDRKVLVFSFFLDTIRVIGDLLGARCYGPINGSVPPPLRQQIIDEFDKAPAGSVLLAQIQSAGTGLNIQSASVVVICEPQFKPSTENQAISRAYRMGQARNVLVYRLLCENTIDEKITELLEYKQDVFNAFADKSVAAEKTQEHDSGIDNKKFGEIIQEEIDRINAERGAQNKETLEKADITFTEQ